MNILVLGLGAMGSLYAVHFANNGHRVWAVDPCLEHVAAVRAHGLHITGSIGERVGWPFAQADLVGIPRCEVVILSTKSVNATDAARDAVQKLTENGLLICIQNGVGAFERIRKVVGHERLLAGVAGGFGARVISPGRVHHEGWERLEFGEFGSVPSERVRYIADLFVQAGFRVDIRNDGIEYAIWEKLLCNVSANAICAITEMTIGDVLNHAEARQICKECAWEAFSVAKAMGLQFEFADPFAFVISHASKIPAARTSMSADLAARRRTEIDDLNGCIVALAKQHGIPVPVNATLTGIIRAKENQSSCAK
jgi:2-dehydropantoate 2-reductase